MKYHIEFGFQENIVPFGFSTKGTCKGFFIAFLGFLLHIGKN